MSERSKKVEKEKKSNKLQKGKAILIPVFATKEQEEFFVRSVRNTNTTATNEFFSR